MKSEDEKSLVKSELLGRLVLKGILVLFNVVFIYGQWIRPPDQVKHEIRSHTIYNQLHLEVFFLWLPFWVKSSFALFLWAAFSLFVLEEIKEAKKKNKLTVWRSIANVPEVSFYFLITIIVFKYFLIDGIAIDK